MDLKGKVVLVTGATRGVGRSLAIELGRLGAEVIISGRTAAPGSSKLAGSLEETAAAVVAAGGVSHSVTGDLSDAAQVEDLATKALAWKGRVDVLVNNAAFLGRASYHSLDELTLLNWQRQFDVNVTAPFLLTKLLAPSMRTNGGGAVVNLTSLAGELWEGTIPGIAYGATKAAVNRLTLALAKELRPDNIAVFAFEPGYVRTEIAEAAAEASNMDIDVAHDPDVPAQGIIELLGRPLADVTARIFGVPQKDPHPVLRHDGVGPRQVG